MCLQRGLSHCKVMSVIGCLLRVTFGMDKGSLIEKSKCLRLSVAFFNMWKCPF